MILFIIIIIAALILINLGILIDIVKSYVREKRISKTNTQLTPSFPLQESTNNLSLNNQNDFKNKHSLFDDEKVDLNLDEYEYDDEYLEKLNEENNEAVLKENQLIETNEEHLDILEDVIEEEKSQIRLDEVNDKKTDTMVIKEKRLSDISFESTDGVSVDDILESLKNHRIKQLKRVRKEIETANSSDDLIKRLKRYNENRLR